MSANTKFGAKEVMDVTLYDMASGKPVIYFDTLKTSTIEVTSEKVYARGGKGNSKLITWDINREGKLTIEDALLSPKSIDLVTGMMEKNIGADQKIITMRQDTVWVDGVDQGAPLTASSTGVIELAFAPKETAEKILIYSADDDCGEPLGEATLTDKQLTCAAAKDKDVVVYYTCAAPESADIYIVDANKFSGTYKLVGDTVVRNQATGKDEAFQITIPNLKWASNLTLAFSAEGDPSTTSFECEILKPTNSSTMIQMVKW